MIELKLNKDIYSEDNIKKTVSVYQGYALIDIINSDSNYVLRFNDCKYSEILTIKEFENYLIGIENSRI